MRRHDRPEVQVSGLLADRAAGFAAYLAGRGYAWSSTKHHLYLMADLSAWLAGQGLAAEDLTGPVTGRFWEDLRARGSYLVKGTSVEPFLGYLRSIGVLPQQRAGGPASAAGVLLQEYDRYLRVGRRAGEVTITQYLRYANEFLTAAGEPPDGPQIDARLAALNGAQVLDVVSRQVARHRLPSIGAVLTGDRAFLRFLERTGRTARPLAAAVPLAARQPSRLPEQVDPATAAVILASCDRATEGGCRDRAVLLLLHRYGLRPVEVTRLELPDLRWRAGEFVVHGKAGRVDVLPLLRDAGEAIVEYLRIRRPAPPGVAAVFLSARAPVQPMRKSSVGALAGRACARAGVPRIGPRAFRHAVGHDLLKGGASLVEIRDVLRHRDIETTSAYPGGRIRAAAASAPLARHWQAAGGGDDPVTGPLPAAALSALAEEYLAFRRRLGFEMDKPGFLVRRFAGYCDGAGITRVTGQAVLDWVLLAQPVAPSYRWLRLNAARGFAIYLHALDPAHQIPAPDLVPCRRDRPAPCIMSSEAIQTLMEAAGRLRPELHAATFQTLTGLIAATGMRTCEAVRADDSDIDPAEAAMTLHGKNRRDRRIPLHPTTLEALAGYQQLRGRLLPGYAGPSLLVNTRGRRLNADQARTHFAHLADTAGLGVLTPRPTLRALRHTFAVTTLTGWLNDDADTQASLPLLQAHMGHTKPRHTFWYYSDSRVIPKPAPLHA